MDDSSASAEPPVVTAPLPAGAPRIVATVNAREAHWFLEPAGAALGADGDFSWLTVVEDNRNRALAAIQAANPEVLVTCWSSPFLPDAWLESPACRLKYVCHLTGSVRHVVSRRFIERGGWVTNWGTIPSGAVAEHALLLALAALRTLPRWREVFLIPRTASNHMESLRVSTLFGRRVGIHGFGQVAQALVRLLEPFKVPITVYSPGVPKEAFTRAGVDVAGSLRELCAASDVVFECEALTATTRHAVGAAELAALRDDAVFVNVARGGLVDDAALLREATSGRLRVALDVFATEPLPPDSPWLQLPGVVLSPHMAGPTFDQYPACTQAALGNIRRYLQRRPLESIVTTEIYDRST
jgi:phosphoglycerate dehydrogenase-like enzyme